jgi:hypothetical protein
MLTYIFLFKILLIKRIEKLVYYGNVQYFQNQIQNPTKQNLQAVFGESIRTIILFRTTQHSSQTTNEGRILKK